MSQNQNLQDVYVELSKCLTEDKLSQYLEYFVIHEQPVISGDTIDDYKSINVSVTRGANEGYIISVDGMDDDYKLHAIMWGKTLKDIDTALEVSNKITRHLYSK